jgi:twitching motility protein PilT
MKQDEATCPEPLRQWLTLAVDREASDLHLVVGHPPVLRVHGVLYPLDEPELEAQRLEALLLPACPSPYAERFKHEKNTDFSLSVTLDTQPQRFRANYFFNGQHIGACFRPKFLISNGPVFPRSWPSGSRVSAMA